MNKHTYPFTKLENRHLWRLSRRQLGEHLVSLRLKAGLTTEHLNQLTGITRLYLENMEVGRGDIMLSVLIRLAYFYGRKIKIELVEPIAEDWANCAKTSKG